MEFEKCKVTSNEITGRGSDDAGEFTIKGTVLENGEGTLEVKFDKQYIGKHCVIYSGEVNKELT
jgi:hypothetical protein